MAFGRALLAYSSVLPVLQLLVALYEEQWFRLCGVPIHPPYSLLVRGRESEGGKGQRE